MIYIVKIPQQERRENLKALRRLAKAQKVKFIISDEQTVIFAACPVANRIKFACDIEEILSQDENVEPYLMENCPDDVISIGTRRK